MLDVKTDIGQSRDSVQDIVQKYEQAIESQMAGELPRCISRLYHVQSRLERIRPTDSDSANIIDELLTVAYDSLVKIHEYNITAPKPTPRKQAAALQMSHQRTHNAQASGHAFENDQPSVRNVENTPPIPYSRSSADIRESLAHLTKKNQ